MQRLRKAKIVVSIVAIASIILTTISPIASAASTFNTEGQVKNALYALAAYQCINNGLLQNTAIGNKRDSILSGIDNMMTKPFVGQWIGDSNGQISCKEAITKTLGDGTITTAMLGTGKVFNGVYVQSATGEQQIQCNYGIVNSSDTATMDGVYSWPQGYFRDMNGNLQDRRSHGVIQIVFNESGPIRLVGAISDIDTTHTLESMRGYTINWSKPEKICQTLVMYTEVYPAGEVTNALGETFMAYEPVLATTDGTPFNEWGIHVDDRYHAWVHSNSSKFTHTLSDVTSATQLELTSDAKNKLLSNISTLYIGGATDIDSFLNSYPNAKYILYGRYLFNGDGNGSFACGGISVATDDPNFSNLNATDYWDTSQPYVAVVNAYKESTATSKSTFRTKFGGDGLLSPGTVKSIYFPGVSGDCKALAGEFNNISVSSNTAKAAVKNFMNVGSVEELPETNTPGSTDPGSDVDGNAGALDGCFGNAGVLGWIVCPVIKFVGETVSGIYDMIVENYLTMGAATVSDSAVRNAWGTFQGYANIIFAILLLVVILSQVTGIGLDNYGIKKILPKLIITVVLVNLSFVLCAVAVDVSNITGSGINDLFKNMDAGGLGANDFNLAVFAVNTLESLFSVGAAAGGIAIAGYVISISGGWGMLLLPLLLALLTALIGIIFFFILLGVRQAAIILLLVISPIAIVMYALPNTKKYFDRWIKMFGALLLVYPICGLMMGGGNFASRLLLSAGSNAGFMYYLVAMLVQVVPFFMIPTVLKTSMSALGNLGAKISGMGDRLGGFATRSIRNSRGYQEHQQEALRNSNMTRNKRIMDRTKLSDADQKTLNALREKRASGATLTNDERRTLSRLSSSQYRYARAASARERALRDEIEADTISNRGAFDYGSERYQTAVSDSDKAQRLKDVKEQRSLFESGLATYTDASGHTVQADVDSIASLQAAHESLLQETMANPENKLARAKLEAVQELLADKKEDGLEAIHSNLLKMSANASSNLQSAGVKNAIRHLRDRYGGDIKSGNRAFDKLITHLQNGDLESVRSTVQANAAARGDTRDLSELLAGQFAKESMSGYEAGNLNSMHDAALDRYIDMAQNGDMEREELTNFTKMLNDAYTSGHINLKGKVGQKVQDFLQEAYGSGAIARTSANAKTTVTDGSAAFEHASLQSLQQLSSGIRQGTITGAAAQHIVENARRYMESGALIEPERAEEFRQIISAAQQQGITGMGSTSISPDNFDYDESAFKVRNAPQKLKRAEIPANWKQVRVNPLDPNSALQWVEENGTSRRVLTKDELAHIRSVQRTNLEREKENARRGFDPTPPPAP